MAQGDSVSPIITVVDSNGVPIPLQSVQDIIWIGKISWLDSPHKKDVYRRDLLCDRRKQRTVHGFLLRHRHDDSRASRSIRLVRPGHRRRRESIHGRRSILVAGNGKLMQFRALIKIGSETDVKWKARGSCSSVLRHVFFQIAGGPNGVFESRPLSADELAWIESHPDVQLEAAGHLPNGQLPKALPHDFSKTLTLRLPRSQTAVSGIGTRPARIRSCADTQASRAAISPRPKPA